MQKLLLRILFAILIVFFLFFSYSTYQYYLAIHSDDPIVPYVFVEEGALTVVRGDIAIDMIKDDIYDLREKDVIISVGESLGVIYWPDKSITRLGKDSRIRIERMIVARDYTSIEIEFALEQGRVWSTVVRTIYPGSYFRTKLPNQGVVAGVRGTVYDIDLMRGYVRSVDHSISLSDNRGNSVNLLPGELVSTTNILKKLAKEIVDQGWNAMNHARDIAFLDAHRETIQIHLDALSHDSHNMWDRFVRWILSFVPMFDELEIIELFLYDTSTLENLQVPREQLLGIYQKFQDTKFVQERDRIRRYITSQSGTLGFDKEYFQAFTRGAVWDQLSFSGMTLEGAQGFVTDYTKTLDAQIQSVMRAVPVSQMDTKARETLRMLIK